jgi:L-threonylcarbamoyladenylate synthase
VILDGRDPAAVRRAAAQIRGGGVVAFPTETVYGLGASALDVRAVARIFEIKRRPSFDPLIVHIASARDLRRVALAEDPRARRLAQRFWPGPLTLVLPKRPAIPDLVTAGLPTVGVRVPDHPVAWRLIREAGVPIAAPSANPFGYLSPTTAEHVERHLGRDVDLILDGGPCRVGIESTVVSLVEKKVLLLRPGGTPAEEIRRIVGSLRAARRAGQAPGQLPSHYAPRTPLAPLGARVRGRVGLLAYRSARPGFAAVEVLSPAGDLREAAARLFGCLRSLDAAGLDAILYEPVPRRGLGRAILDRLRRGSVL